MGEVMAPVARGGGGVEVIDPGPRLKRDRHPSRDEAFVEDAVLAGERVLGIGTKSPKQIAAEREAMRDRLRGEHPARRDQRRVLEEVARRPDEAARRAVPDRAGHDRIPAPMRGQAMLEPPRARDGVVGDERHILTARRRNAAVTSASRPESLHRRDDAHVRPGRGDVFGTPVIPGRDDNDLKALAERLSKKRPQRRVDPRA